MSAETLAEPTETVARTKRRNRGPVTQKEREMFLASVEVGSTVTSAAEAIGRPPETMRHLLRHDRAFAEVYERAYEASADVLETEAWRRATTPDKHGRYSDRLLELLLSARRPFRYRAGRLEVTGANGGPVAVVTTSIDPRAVLEVLAGAGLVAPELPPAPRRAELES